MKLDAVAAGRHFAMPGLLLLWDVLLIRIAGDQCTPELGCLAVAIFEGAELGAEIVEEDR